MLRSIGSVTLLALFLVGCGGGGSSPAIPTYSVGGTVTGLAGSGLVLDSDFGGDLAVSASGSFTFGTRLLVGSTFKVGVKNQPTSPAQTCQVTNGTGTIAAANVVNVTVTCGAGYTIRGTVWGLQGSGLVLQIEDAGVRGGHSGHDVFPPLQITSNGPFTLVESPPTVGNALVAVISQQPASPSQFCLMHYEINFQAPISTDIEVRCSEYAYVANAGDNTVSAYAIDATSGGLAAVGTPPTTGMSPHAIVGTYEKTYVFVGNEGSNDISAFAVNVASGALTPVAGSPFAAGTDPKALALNQGYSTYLYVANAGSDTLSAFAVDTSSGSLTPLSPATYATGKGPASIVLDGSFLYVANNGGSNDISVFAIDPEGSGALLPVPGSPFPAGGNPLSLALGAQSKFLYTANPDATNPSISGFSIDRTTGALSSLSGSPFPLPVSHYIAADVTGAYLYVTSGGNVVGYYIQENTGALTALPGFPVATGANANSITIDPTAQFLYVANDGAANVSGFRLDLSTGALTPMAGSPFHAGNLPEFIATF